MERHVLAHELGHAILHPKINITYLESNTFYSKEKFEIATNTFAAELLLRIHCLMNISIIQLKKWLLWKIYL